MWLWSVFLRLPLQDERSPRPLRSQPPTYQRIECLDGAWHSSPCMLTPIWRSMTLQFRSSLADVTAGSEPAPTSRRSWHFSRGNGLGRDRLPCYWTGGCKRHSLGSDLRAPPPLRLSIR